MIIALLTLGLNLSSINAFIVVRHNHVDVHNLRREPPQHPQPPSSLVCPREPFLLFAKKRGNLSALVEDGGSGFSSTKQRRKGKKSASAVQISPDLAKFMESKGDSNASSSVTTTSPESKRRTKTKEPTEEDDDDDTSATFSSFKASKRSSSRRIRQSQRQQQEQERSSAVQSIVDDLTNAIANRTTTAPLIAVQTALQSLPPPSTTLTALTKSPTPLDYRLLWVATDAHVCGVGSALHPTVPLARLQEVFLTLHRNRWQWVEVLRILGPFPNVKNTLLGGLVVRKKSKSAPQQQQHTIAWDSMVDGTGRERLPEPGETKEATVTVAYADASLIVLEHTISEPEETEPPAGGYLVFVREEEMESKLDQLRVL